MVMETQEQSAGFVAGGAAGKLVVFTLDELRYSLPLDSVERIVRMVEITSLPKAPEIVAGVINVHGEILPVMNVRRRFRLPERQADLKDHLVIAHTSRRRVALGVDAVTGVVVGSAKQITSGDQIMHGLDYVEGVVKLEDGLILIHNLDTFLSFEEETALEQALTAN